METLLNLLDSMRELNIYSMIFRILLGVVLAGIIGVEREDHNRAAGFRTHVLVCIGSALVMMTSQYMNSYFTTVNADPARLGAQVISGIGFLGAGTIIITGAQIKGLTTAAGLWSVACMGIAIGIGFYEGAIIGGLSIYLSIVLLSKLSRKIHKHSSIMDIYLEMPDLASMSDVMQIFALRNCRVNNIEFRENAVVNRDSRGIVFTLKVTRSLIHDELVSEINDLENVLYCDEISY